LDRVSFSWIRIVYIAVKNSLVVGFGFHRDNIVIYSFQFKKKLTDIGFGFSNWILKNFGFVGFLDSD
jgi:hypothetical protein